MLHAFRSLHELRVVLLAKSLDRILRAPNSHLTITLKLLHRLLLAAPNRFA
jgi:hypothetical protein